MTKQPPAPSRRDFLRTAARASATVGGLTLLGATAKGQGRVFKVGLVACGGRGSGALQQHVEAAQFLNKTLTLGIEVRVVAVGDYYKSRAENAGQRHGLDRAHCFGGPSNYRGVIESGPDIVLLCSPPVFRPAHLEAAVAAGKHVFMEKPVAVDPVGCRRIIAAGEEAQRRGLMIVAGTQRRHERGYNERAAMIREGAYGRVLAGRVGWCQGHLGAGSRSRGIIDANYMINTWWDFAQMSGDHMVEQHVHNLDIACWFLGAHPTACAGFGGHARRPAGNQFDFFSVDYEFPGGVHIHSMCRQISNCWTWVGEDFVYEHQPPQGFRLQNPIPYADIPQIGGGHQQEHVNLLYYLVRGLPLNEARNVATATATAVMGRTSAYTGQRIEWAEMMEDPHRKPELYNLQLRPTAEDFERGTVEPPPEGVYPVPGTA